jgi:hypothetical protein
MKNTDKNTEIPQSLKTAVSGSLYPTYEQILEMAEDFNKDINESIETKRATNYAFVEGMYKMLEIWEQSKQ